MISEKQTLADQEAKTNVTGETSIAEVSPRELKNVDDRDPGRITMQLTSPDAEESSEDTNLVVKCSETNLTGNKSKEEESPREYKSHLNMRRVQSQRNRQDRLKGWPAKSKS